VGGQAQADELAGAGECREPFARAVASPGLVTGDPGAGESVRRWLGDAGVAQDFGIGDEASTSWR